MKTAAHNTSKANKNYGFNLAAETWDDGYALVWKEAGRNVYTVNEPHFPGGFSRLGFINNRAFLYQVETNKLGPHLLMVGLPGSGCIPKVQKLEADSGLFLLVIAASGDSHHMAMKSWLEAYPKTTFVHSSVKFPYTRNGTSILSNETYKQQIILTDGNKFPLILMAYEDVVKFVGFNQCMIIADKEYMSSDSKNPTKLQGLSYLKNIAGETSDTKFLCIWSYHVPSKTLMFEHNFQMFIDKDLKRNMPLLGKLLVPGEQLKSCGKGPFPKLPTDPEGARIHCQTMAKILTLDVRALMDFHVGCGKMPRTYQDGANFQKEMRNILKATGEDNPSGESLVQYMNQKALFCC